MDHDIEDLESLLSDHFGRTPVSTPFGSQEDCDELENVANLAIESDNEEPDIDIDLRAREYLESLPPERNSEVDSDSDQDTDRVPQLTEEDEDAKRILQFRKDGCGCKQQCIQLFSDTDVYEHILNVREMDKQDKEMYIMATVVGTFDKDVTKRGKKRQKCRHNFTLIGKPVCRSMFMFSFDVKRTCLQNILSHVDQHGVVQRVHGNMGRKPSGSLQYEDIKFVASYICQTAEEIGLPQPAAPRGTDNVAPVYLPSATTKLEIHSHYKISCEESEPPKRVLHYKTFSNIWRQCLPHIKIASPRDDVCAKCEKLRKQIMDSRTEEEKLENTEVLRTHILSAQREREIYNKCIDQARGAATTEGSRYIHFTFDFSQSVSLPHHARQMGPTFFLSLRKVQLFGVRNDGVPKQYNFLIDEAETIGSDGTQCHGPNSVISMLHWAIEHDHAAEPSISLHADNCPGQNKNQFMLGYLMWRVMTGCQDQIEYLMQVPGHARCHVDAGFAAIKRLYRRTDSDSIDQLTDVVNRSSATNECVRYPAWTWRDWKTFLKPYFKPLPGIRKFQYFRFRRSQPGIVVARESSEGSEQTFNIMKSRGVILSREHMPHVLQAGGLSVARKNYLHNVVRPYVRPACQDMTCPP